MRRCVRVAQSPTPISFRPMPATAKAQMGPKMSGKRRCFDCVLIDGSMQASAAPFPCF
jgi:hypothetical protein